MRQAAAALILATALPRPPARAASVPAGVTTPVPLAASTSPSPATRGISCGFLDVSCQIGNAITSWFAALARDALKPLLTLAGQTLLSSPQPGAIPAVHSMWATSLAIADSAYVLLVLIGGVIVMGHETLQTSYSAKEIAPRLVTGFLAANLSLVLISRATTIANALSAALAGDGVTPATATSALLGTLTAPLPGGGILLVLLALAGAVLALVLAVVYVLRLMALVLLTAAAPLALACYALPQTAWAARWWWRALTVCLGIQAAQALVLTAAVRVFSSAGWIPLHGTRGGSVLPVLTALCLLYIMMRIPWWISRPVLSAFGPSPVRRTVKFAFYAAVLSRVSPLLRGTAGPRRPPSAGGGRGRGPAGPRGGRPAGPGGSAAAPGGRPGTGPGSSTSTGPGRGQPGGTGPQRTGAGAGPRRGPGRPGAPSRGPGGKPRPRPPAPGRPAARPRPAPQQRARPPALAQPVFRPPRPDPPQRPGTPQPAQPAMRSGVTRVPRSGAPAPRPGPAQPQRPARPPGQRPLPPGAQAARQPRAADSRLQPPGRRQAPAAPRAARPGR